MFTPINQQKKKKFIKGLVHVVFTYVMCFDKFDHEMLFLVFTFTYRDHIM